MIRTTTAVVVLAGALALGTASATSLGTFDDIAFAASDVGLLDCQVSGLELLDLVPDLPSVGDDLSVAAVGSTLNLGLLDLSLLDTLDPACLTGTVVDVVLVDGAGVVLDVIQVDPDVDDLATVAPNRLLDVVDVAAVRVVVREA